MSDSPHEANQRQNDFLISVRQRGTLWVLMDDGGLANWSDPDEGDTVVPVWANENDARACAVGSFAEYKPHSIELAVFVESYLAQLTDLGAWVAINPTADRTGNQLPPDRLRSALCDDA